jgi:chemotaxis protein CheZ
MEASMDRLRQELDGLMRYIQRVRQEIAAIDRPTDGDDRFESMGEQLEAVVAATGAATNTIMEAMESNEQLLDALRETITDPAQIAALDRLTANGNAVFEACAFQDITGQRVNKVVKSVTYVEERVNALVDIWGRDKLAEIEIAAEPEKSADEDLLHGPQLDGQGLSQDDIDKLFD